MAVQLGSDCDDELYIQFSHVPDFCFSRENYDTFLNQASNYKIN